MTNRMLLEGFRTFRSIYCQHYEPILQGKSDTYFVRTDCLEALSLRATTFLKDLIHVINTLVNIRQRPRFSCLSKSRHYDRFATTDRLRLSIQLELTALSPEAESNCVQLDRGPLLSPSINLNLFPCPVRLTFDTQWFDTNPWKQDTSRITNRHSHFAKSKSSPRLKKRLDRQARK